MIAVNSIFKCLNTICSLFRRTENKRSCRTGLTVGGSHFDHVRHFVDWGRTRFWRSRVGKKLREANTNWPTTTCLYFTSIWHQKRPKIAAYPGYEVSSVPPTEPSASLLGSVRSDALLGYREAARRSSWWDWNQRSSMKQMSHFSRKYTRHTHV